MSPSAALALGSFALVCFPLLGGTVAPGSDIEQALPEPVAAALQGGDECATGGESEGQCALAALQRRGVKKEAAAAATTNPCRDTALGLMLKDKAPGCVEACPQICAAATPLLALVNSGEAVDMVCGAEGVQLSCALEPANAAACAPALRELEAAWPAMPRTPALLATACRAARGNGSSLLAVGEASTARALVARAMAGDSKARQRMLDLSVLGKEDDPRCEHAQEGQTCSPGVDGEYSNSYVYCSAKKRLSSGATSCESKRGRLSRCVVGGGPSPLEHDDCDDPFCRNGGAYAGTGLYCHGSSIVSCQDRDGTPNTVDSCSDRSFTNMWGCDVTKHYECRGHHPQPYCAFSGRTRDCHDD